MDKQEIRRKIKNRKQLLTDQERQHASKAVFDRLEQTAAFLLAERVMLYHSLPDELPTHDFLRRWSTVKQFFLPRVAGVNLEILPYNADSLAPGAFDIEEPQEGQTVDPATIDLIVVPAVALDRRGNRLGRGRGFYDRLLPSTRAVTVGVAYDFQLVEEIPAEPHDIPLDIVISESEMHCINRHPGGRAGR